MGDLSHHGRPKELSGQQDPSFSMATLRIPCRRPGPQDPGAGQGAWRTKLPGKGGSAFSSLSSTLKKPTPAKGEPPRPQIGREG